MEYLIAWSITYNACSSKPPTQPADLLTTPQRRTMQKWLQPHQTSSPRYEQNKTWPKEYTNAYKMISLANA